MKCQYCGTKIGAEEYVCPRCGQVVRARSLPGDKRSFWWALLSFILPPLGLILAIAWRKKYRLRSKSCVKGTIFGIIFYALAVGMFFLFVYEVIKAIGEGLSNIKFY